MMFFLLESELTDSMALKLSYRITNSPDLRRLAIGGLGLEEHVVNKHLNDERDIREASCRVLRDWRVKLQSSRVAYRRLCEAVKVVGMESYIELLQEKYTENDMNGINKQHFPRVDNVKSVYSLVATLSKHSQMLGLMCIGAYTGVCVHKYSHFFLKFHKQ